MRNITDKFSDLINENPENYELHRAHQLLDLIKKNKHGENLSDKELNIIYEFADTYSCGFYTRFSSEYSFLTPHSIKICVFIRIGLKLEHLSYLCGTIKDSVRRQKNRIKKKMGLDSNANLDEFIKKY